MIKVVQQKGIVRLALRRKTIAGKSGVHTLFFCSVPVLRVGWIRYYGVNTQRGKALVIFERPILLKRVGVAGSDISRFNTAHDQIHTSQVISVLL